MGLNQGTRTNRIFLNIIQGSIRKRADENTAGAEIRHSEKLGKDVYELVYPSITGIITSLKISNSEYGEILEVEISDVGDKYVLNIPLESRYFNSFANKVKNINFNSELTLLPYDFEDKTETNKKTGKPKKITGINIYQPSKISAENKVPNYYTKDSPSEGQPRLPEKYTDAQLKIFFIEQQEFYKGIVNEYSRKIVSADEVKSEMENVPDFDTADTIANDDQLPF